MRASRSAHRGRTEPRLRQDWQSPVCANDTLRGLGPDTPPIPPAVAGRLQSSRDAPTRNEVIGETNLPIGTSRTVSGRAHHDAVDNLAHSNRGIRSSRLRIWSARTVVACPRQDRAHRDCAAVYEDLSEADSSGRIEINSMVIRKLRLKRSVT